MILEVELVRYSAIEGQHGSFILWIKSTIL